jgi:hypothetical protein
MIGHHLASTFDSAKLDYPILFEKGYGQGVLPELPTAGFDASNDGEYDSNDPQYDHQRNANDHKH